MKRVVATIMLLGITGTCFAYSRQGKVEIFGTAGMRQLIAPGSGPGVLFGRRYGAAESFDQTAANGAAKNARCKRTTKIIRGLTKCSGCTGWVKQWKKKN